MAHDTQKLPDNWEPGTDSDLNVPMIVFVSLIGTVLLVVIIFFLRALYFATVTEEVAVKLAQSRYAALSDLEAAQLVQIQGYEWVDVQAGLVSIPIDRAMELVVSERSGQGNAALTYRRQSAIPGDFVYTLTEPEYAPSDWTDSLHGGEPHPSGVTPTAQQIDPQIVDEHGMPPGTQEPGVYRAEDDPTPGQPGGDHEGRPADEPTALPEDDSEGI